MIVHNYIKGVCIKDSMWKLPDLSKVGPCDYIIIITAGKPADTEHVEYDSERETTTAGTASQSSPHLVQRFIGLGPRVTAYMRFKIKQQTIAKYAR